MHKPIPGGDSTVRFENGQVVKRYHNLSLEHLLFYSEITNSLSNYRWGFQDIEILVNPINKIALVDNKVEAISNAVYGSALNTFNDKSKRASLGYYMTNLLSPELNKLTRCSGINVVSWNVMCPNNSTAIITDICSDVSRLKRF